MGERIEFTRNYSDLSTNKGFQFEFYCDRCGSGYRTRFKPSVSGTLTEVLDTAGSLFGGIFNSAANVGERMRSATWEKAHDEAFMEAMRELKPDFIQCPRCSSWVCRKSCWNVKKGLCKECAPDMGVEMAAAQASRSVEEVWAHAAMSEEDKKLAAGNWRENIRASCPECEAPLQSNAKFCPECGARLKAKTECPNCGEKFTPGAKFCPECGQKL
ncbi:MAG: zinc ribbon domain-containing protein [Syntrophomonadaceae bacterium]|jgi:membrane protease subunit (stomatin/prohibitin family)|nr:zinc ribbon domain-containing protein [Syntrophomonadaceae bacterium]